jgi:hypothetical protein
MSRFTQTCFAAGSACLLLAALLRFVPEAASPEPKIQTLPAYRRAAAPRPRRSSLGSIAPRRARTIAIPASHRARVIARSASPLPVWRGSVQKKRSSEELLERALRELARRAYEREIRERTERPAEIAPEVPEVLDDIAVEPEPKRNVDPLAHLPAIRRRPDIRFEGTSFTPFGFRPFKSDWADVVYRQFKTPGLI